MNKWSQNSGASAWVRAVLATAVIALSIALATWLSASPIIAETSVDAAGRYKLVAADGTLFDRASLRGNPAVVYFGYTSCPDMCPAMLSRLVKARASLGLPAADLRIVFITIDPERDTPERLARFSSQFGGEVIALTGSSEVIHTVADKAGVFVKRTNKPDGTAVIEHTTSAFLYDREDFFVDAIAPGESETALLKKLQVIISVLPDAPKPSPSDQAGR